MKAHKKLVTLMYFLAMVSNFLTSDEQEREAPRSSIPYSHIPGPNICFISTEVIGSIRLFGVCTKKFSIAKVNHICESIFMIDFNFLTPTFKASSLQFKDQSYFFFVIFILWKLFSPAWQQSTQNGKLLLLLLLLYLESRETDL